MLMYKKVYQLSCTVCEEIWIEESATIPIKCPHCKGEGERKFKRMKALHPSRINQLLGKVFKK